MLTGRSRNSTVEPKLMHTGQAGLFTGANSLRLTGERVKCPRWNVFTIRASPISARSLIPAAIDPAHIAIPPEKCGQIGAISLPKRERCGNQPQTHHKRDSTSAAHDSVTSWNHSRVPAIGFSAEKLRVNECVKQPLAFPLALVPETLRLRKRQLQARHFEILSTNPTQELRIRRETGGNRRLFGNAWRFARPLGHQPRGNHCRAGFRRLRLRGWRENRRYLRTARHGSLLALTNAQ